MFTDSEKHLIDICLRDTLTTGNLWVKLIAKMWEYILDLENELENTRDKDTEEALNKKGK